MNNHVSFHTSHMLYRPNQTKKGGRGTKNRENELIIKKGETPCMTSVKVVMHTWY